MNHIYDYNHENYHRSLLKNKKREKERECQPCTISQQTAIQVEAGEAVLATQKILDITTKVNRKKKTNLDIQRKVNKEQDLWFHFCSVLILTRQFYA